MNISLEKLAKIADVSVGTVSKAFSESREISQATKQKIFALAKEYDCFEKYYKPKKAKTVIGVICPELKSPYYSFMVSRIETELAKHNVITFVCTSNFNEKRESEIISYLTSSKSVDGVIVIGGSAKIKFNKDLPTVAVHTNRSISEVDCINVDFKNATQESIKLLKDFGHEKIGFIGEKLTLTKQKIFQEAMQCNKMSINADWIFTEEERFEQAGKLAMQKILAQQERPTAILCAYDHIALGAIEVIKKHGMSVPEDFSLIGYDDIPIASHVNVDLTTIKTDNDLICDLVVDLILKKLNSKFYALHQQITPHAQLIIRNSVRKIK